MSQRDHCTQSKFDLESEGNIQHDQAQRSKHSDTAIIAELCAHLRPDKFNPAQLDAHICRSPQLIDHQRSLIVRIAIRQANQDVAIRTKADHDRTVVPLLIKGRADSTQIGTVTVFDLDERATREIKPPIKLFQTE